MTARARARKQAKTPETKDCAWDAERERTGEVCREGNVSFFHFNYDKKDWMRTTCLLPSMLVVRTSRVDVEIHRGGVLYDEGTFWVNIQEKKITVSGFKHCFAKIRDGKVRGIAAAHLEKGDTIILKNIHNGMFKRSHLLKERGEHGILSVFSLPRQSAPREQVLLN